ncbi:thiolase-like protein [Phlegmacium glaucopus]|nr:thiolase-like protein [Phlegmacium glaucopus]
MVPIIHIIYQRRMLMTSSAVEHLQSGQGESVEQTHIHGNSPSFSDGTILTKFLYLYCRPGTFGFLSAQEMTSSDSQCATFTNEADGYVPSEGAAGIILKTQSAAICDGDNILAVVGSTGVKHNGRSQGLVAPNLKVQITMQISLLEKANLALAEIDFIEVHETGGRPILNMYWIIEVLQSSHGPENPLIIGAAKSCVSHAETVSGPIGMIKTLSSFAAGVVPGLIQLRSDNMNPSIDCSIIPLHIPTETVELKKSEDGLLHAMIL